MSDIKLAYPGEDDVPVDHRVCTMCEYGSNQNGLGLLVPIGNGRWTHISHIRAGWQTGKHHASNDNIWAFASKFKYFTAASGTDGIAPTVEDTFPRAEMPKEQEATRSDTKIDTASDGTYKPPTTF